MIEDPGWLWILKLNCQKFQSKLRGNSRIFNSVNLVEINQICSFNNEFIYIYKLEYLYDQMERPARLVTKLLQKVNGR